MQQDGGKRVCVHILFTTLLFSAELIYNSWWCSDCPSKATMRSELHNEHFSPQGFECNSLKFCIFIRNSGNEAVSYTEIKREQAAFVREFKFNLSVFWIRLHVMVYHAQAQW